MAPRTIFFVSAALSSALLLTGGYFLSAHLLWGFLLVGPLVIIGLQDVAQQAHTIRRIYPVIGRGRYAMEWLRPKIYQYFIESDTDGMPINRVNRTVVYERAKQVPDTSPFGTQFDVYGEGYEWMSHSLDALPVEETLPNANVRIGEGRCEKPYDLSLLNISALSYGSLSAPAIEALNKGAAAGGFAHNTGEGGISPYHLRHGADLIWQLGTAYFGARTPEGEFDRKQFRKTATKDAVKMIELKLSQGAKPGHGGILPAKKNTPEIAAIRGVEPYTEVRSPPTHSEFSTPRELLAFVDELRELSGGKPVGIKLCIGRRSEFLGLCKAMLATGSRPDYIAVDGSEGGTGAAPAEFSNAVGAPMREGLTFVDNALIGYGLRQEIHVLAAGKIFSAMDMMTAFALGADSCYSARGFMLAVGCVQALTCDSNKCPTGVTTMNPKRTVGLVIADKAPRVQHYQERTVYSLNELLAAAGLRSVKEVKRWHVYRRVSQTAVQQLSERYPYIPEHSLKKEPYPPGWSEIVKASTAESFSGNGRTVD